MKRAAAIVVILTASALFAQEADWLEEVPPVVPAAPPSAMAVALRPVVVALLEVLERPAPDPVALRAALERMTPADVARVVAGAAARPEALAVLVEALPAGAVPQVIAELAGNPPALAALVARLTPEAVARVIVERAGEPAILAATMAAMTPEQAAQVILALAESPEAAEAALAALSMERLQRVSVELFLADVEGWQRVADFMREPLPTKKRKSRWRGNAGWLDASRAALRAKIRGRGYTPELLAEAEALMQEAARPPKKRRVK